MSARQVPNPATQQWRRAPRLFVPPSIAMAAGLGMLAALGCATGLWAASGTAFSLVPAALLALFARADAEPLMILALLSGGAVCLSALQRGDVEFLLAALCLYVTAELAALASAVRVSRSTRTAAARVAVLGRDAAWALGAAAVVLPLVLLDMPRWLALTALTALAAVAVLATLRAGDDPPRVGRRIRSVADEASDPPR